VPTVKTRHLAAVVVLAVVTPAVAAADPVGEPPAPTRTTRKDPRKAIGYAALGIAGGLVLLGGGAAAEADEPAVLGLAAVGIASIAPSAGHIYAGAWGIAAATSLTRVAGLTLLSAGAAQFANHDDGEGGGSYLMAGAILWVGATIVDFVDAPFAAKRANRRSVVVAPTAMSTAHGMTPGLVLGGRF
jgi:hypothetical protein